MPPGEIAVTCSGCGYQLRVPYAAIRRDSMYCPQCGRNIPLGTVQPEDSTGTPVVKKAARRTYRPTRRK